MPLPQVCCTQMLHLREIGNTCTRETLANGRYAESGTADILDGLTIKGRNVPTGDGAFLRARGIGPQRVMPRRLADPPRRSRIVYFPA